MGLTTAEIESIREEHAQKRKERGKAIWTALPSENKWEQD